MYNNILNRGSLASLGNVMYLLLSDMGQEANWINRLTQYRKILSSFQTN